MEILRKKPGTDMQKKTSKMPETLYADPKSFCLNFWAKNLASLGYRANDNVVMTTEYQ
jgi:hypothetical protein